MPDSTRSIAATNTTGIVPAASLAGSTDGAPEATSTSTLRRTSSTATPGSSAALGASPKLDGDALPFDEPVLAQALPEALDPHWGRRPDTQEANALDLAWLLRANRERPSHRAAEQRDELAAS